MDNAVKEGVIMGWLKLMGEFPAEYIAKQICQLFEKEMWTYADQVNANSLPEIASS